MLTSIRSRLIAIVAVSIVPAVAALGLLGYILYENQKRQVEIDMLQTTRALTAAVDRDFSVGMNVAQALVGTGLLANGDFARFHAVAKAVLTDRFPGFTFVLRDRSGQQLLNAIRPFGSPLPRDTALEALDKVFETGKPAVSKLFVGGVIRKPVFSVDVPVWRDGKLAYVLSVGFRPDSLTRLLTEQHLPEGRMAAVFDPDGVIAARTHLADQLIGKKAIPELVSRLLAEPEGIVEAHTLEGLNVIIAFSRSSETGWSVGISTPWTVVLSEALKRITVIYAVAFLLLAAGLALAWVIGGNIGRSIRALTAPVLALGRGEPLAIQEQGLKEATEVGRVLKGVEAELQRYRDHLEALVRERTAALEASNRELEQFAYVASHDLQEPLRVVVSYVDLLSRRHADHLDGEALEFMGFVRQGAMRMSELIKDLLQYSEVGHPPDGAAEVDLHDVVVEAMDLLKASLAECRGEVRIAGPLPVVFGSRHELLSLFRNLIDNAIKYRQTELPPRVEISAERDGGTWIVRVADNGIGIEPQYHEQIFGLFKRLHVQGEYRGTGAGLTVCRKVVERHGGRIWVESQPGQGSTFMIRLPAV